MGQFCKILVTSLILSQVKFFMPKTIPGRNSVSRLDRAHQEELCLCCIIDLLACPLAQEETLVPCLSFLRFPAVVWLKYCRYGVKVLSSQSINLAIPAQ